MLGEPSPKYRTHRIEHGTWQQKKTNFVSRRVIVKVKRPDRDMALDACCDSILKNAEGAQVLKRPGKSGRMVLLIPAGESVPTWAKRIGKDDLVEYAEPDMIDKAQIVPDDLRYPDQWAPPMVNAEDAWDLETGSANVLIGIIDSGISITNGALDHDDLSTTNRITLGTDFVDGGTPRDENGHGTHVAGIAGAEGNNGIGIAGMNWQSPMYICRTLDANGSGSSADFADAVEEITDYALDNGLKAVINYSGGGAKNQTKEDACQYASDNGMLVVAATGNDYGGSVIWPAAYSTTITGVIAVGSTNDDDTVSNFSNIGPEVSVVAPGNNILSTTPTYQVHPNLALNYDTMSGTSMATPLVTGLVALMWSRHPGFTNQKIKECLQNTAVPLGSGDFDNSWGHGRVDALAALKCGDATIPVTKLTGVCNLKTKISTCTLKTILISDCFPKTAICPTTKLQRCPSRLPVLCPNTAIKGCWSEVICLEPVTKITTCGEIKTAICPSAVDGCPSTPGGCEFDPVDPLIRRVRFLENEIRALREELWYKDRPQEVGSKAAAGWFYIDDDGEIHEV